MSRLPILIGIIVLVILLGSDSGLIQAQQQCVSRDRVVLQFNPQAGDYYMQVPRNEGDDMWCVVVEDVPQDAPNLSLNVIVNEDEAGVIAYLMPGEVNSFSGAARITRQIPIFASGEFIVPATGAESYTVGIRPVRGERYEAAINLRPILDEDDTIASACGANRSNCPGIPAGGRPEKTVTLTRHFEVHCQGSLVVELIGGYDASVEILHLYGPEAGNSPTIARTDGSRTLRYQVSTREANQDGSWFVVYSAIRVPTAQNPRLRVSYPEGDCRPSQPTTTVNCSGAPRSRLVVDGTAEVDLAPDDYLRLRSRPTTQSTELAQLRDGTRVSVLEGPTCAQNYAWWRVSAGGQTGWIAEGGGGEYWIRPR